jgi:ERCC4-related helicase
MKLIRLLGLSATPGTNIKAIQAVVDGLRINRIEFREESDPDVKQYVHQRDVQVIVVKQSAIVNEIQKDLDDIILPIFNRLQASGTIGASMANLSSYQLILARDKYTRQTRDRSMLGCFTAAMHLVHLRTILHKNGIGVLRSNILQLVQNRQIGAVAKLSKSDELKNILVKIDKALLDPNSKKHDKKMNNPKLQELLKILHTHYDEVQDISSRAIVFSQYRESVFEIVAVLKESQPKIKPR